MEIKYELRSKIVDGLLTPLVLVLLSVLVALLIRPVDILFQRPGLLIYTILMLAFGILALERCVTPRFSETVQAAWGIVGGLLIWGVIEMTSFIGVHTLTSETGMLSMVLVGLVVGVLWRKVLPLGVKFFSMALLGGWVGHLGVYYINLLVNLSSGGTSLSAYPIFGMIIAGLGLIILLWIFIQSKSRLSRLWGALFLWICIMLLIYIFRGTIV